MQTPRDKLIQTLFDNVNALKRGMYSRLHPLSRMCPIPRSQLELLMTIKHLQPASITALAKHLYLTAGAVSQLAESLAQQDLMERTADPEDRRVQYLRLSKKGEKLLQDVEKQRRTVMESVMRDLTDEELQVWLRIQEKLINQFQSEITKETK